MDKIDSYKNLNEQVNRLLRKREVSDINEEVKIAAQELVEALEDPNRVTMLMRSGLVDSGRVARVRTALKDPEKAMKNTAVRSDLINMLMSLINIITSNPTAFATVKKKAKEMSGASEEPVMEESERLHELSKKTLGSYIKKAAADIDYERTDTNPENEERVEKKVGKRLKGIGRATNKLVREEELSPKQKKIDLNKNKKIDGEDLQMLRKKGDKSA